MWVVEQVLQSINNIQATLDNIFVHLDESDDLSNLQDKQRFIELMKSSEENIVLFENILLGTNE